LKNTWLFPVVQSLHVVGLGLLVGTIALGDYKVLRRRPSETRAGWIYGGLVLMVATGLALFFADAARYLANSAFRLKIALAGLAVAWQFLRRQSRAAASVSLLLWTAVVVTSRLIEDFDK
jgi:hypothetical protein